MKIAHSNLLLTSTRSFMKREEKRESLRVWIDPKDVGVAGDRVTLSQKMSPCIVAEGRCVEETEAELKHSLRTTLEVLLVEVLSGREVKLLDLSVFERNQGPVAGVPPEAMEENRPQEEREGWGIDYSQHGSIREKEAVFFSAAGMIRTQDGKEMEFSLRLDMGREFVSHHNLNIRAGDALLMDPLVINFDGKASELSDMTFSFDLDADGIKEDIPMITPGRGFLSLDLNHDGIINHGHELFGPRTGDGFEELSAHDRDENHWIDENDPIYDHLLLWTMDGQGTPSLSSLRDKGIGAVYIGNLSSPFDLKGSGNELMGQIRKSGIYLKENGTPGTIQQLDLVV
jgi:hypothetical protein